MSMYRPGEAEVRLHVASANTRHATELCIRSIHRYAGYPFELVIGESNSEDGSQELLAKLHQKTKLDLQVATRWMQHYEWLDKWVAECELPYAVFVDSDVEFFQPGWLARLMGVARSGAALVLTSEPADRPGYVDPDTGRKCRIAARLDPSLMVIDVQQVRRLGVSFEPKTFVPSDEVPEGAISWDTGAFVFQRLKDEGLRYEVMPPDFHAAYLHYGGLSWSGGLRGAARRDRLKKLAKIYLHLTKHRVLWPGMPSAVQGGPQSLHPAPNSI